MSNYGGSDDDKIPKSPFAVYRTEADSLFRSGKYNKAIKCYTQALDLQEGDGHCLVARSRCYLFEGNIEKALQDAESSLVNNPKDPKGLFQKAEVFYFKGEFEKALVLFHRGHKARPEMEAFRLGIQKCEEAINNSVGNPHSIKLNLDCDMTYFFMTEEKQNDRIIKKKANPEKEKIVERKACTTNPKTVKQLLGELYADRQYLEKLLKEEESLGKKTQHSKEIRELAVRGLNYLDDRSDFWQQEKPMYARKKFRYISSNDSAFKSKQQRDIVKYVVSTLDEIDLKQSKSEHTKAIKQCEHLLKQINKWSESDLPNRLDIEANVYCLIGNSYLEMGDYDNALHFHEKDNTMGKEHKLEEATSRSIDNLGRVYAKKGDFNKAIEIWNEKILMSKSALESTWLHHEMGRCYLELMDYEKAIEYGEKSIDYAREAEDDTWQMNASILVAQAAVNSKRFGPAIENFDRALEYSKVMKNRDAEKAIKKAIEEVNVKIVEQDKEIRNIEEKNEHETLAEDPVDDQIEVAKEIKQTDAVVENKPEEVNTASTEVETEKEIKSNDTIEERNVQHNEEVDDVINVNKEEPKAITEHEATDNNVETTETVEVEQDDTNPEQEKVSPKGDTIEEIPVTENSEEEKIDEHTLE